MHIFAALPGIAAGFGVAARAHHRDAEWNQSVAQRARSRVLSTMPTCGKSDAKCADQLRQFAVAHGEKRTKFAGGRTQSRQSSQ